MARTNIEDSLWSDQRFLKFLVKIGDEEKALGAIALAWKVAQKYWCPSKGLVPLKEWEASPSRVAMLECGLAELRGDLVYVKGSEKHFAWWFQKQKAGEASGEARQKKPRKPRKKSPDSERTLTDVQQSFDVRQHMSTSSSSSSSSSDSASISSEGENSKNADANAHAFIGTYCRAWKDRYKTNPPIQGKPAGIAKQIVKDLGTERACSLIHSYLQMEDYWFIKKRHDLPTFQSNLNAVVQFHDTGDTIGDTEARLADSASFHKNQMQRIAEGKV